jgi:cobalt-zinc-cadmium efflux system protein
MEHQHAHLEHSHHHHSHGCPGHQKLKGRELLIAFFLNLGLAIFELVGAYFSNSLAIFSDALHDVGDSFSLGMAYLFERYSFKNPDSKYTYGYRRFSLLGALINATVLLGGGLWVIVEAVERFKNPQEVKPEIMLMFAIVGVIVNSISAWRVSKQGGLNNRLVMVHLMEDVFGWVAVLIGSLIMMVKPIPELDAILSIGISLFVIWNVLKVGRRLFGIFMQQVPEGLSIDAIRKKVEALPGVIGTHAVQGWTMDGESHSLTLHVTVAHDSRFEELMQLKLKIKDLFNHHHILHSAVEFESEKEHCHSHRHED